MALHLNLYHEVQLQQLQRQRDPLKLGLYALVVVGGFLLAYYAYCVQQASSVVKRSKELQTQWQMSDPKSKEAAIREKELKVISQSREALVQHIEGRFYWAPLLQKVLQSVPRNVQITTFQGVVSPAANTGGLTISGIAAGPEPRKASEDFRTSFASKCLDGYKDVTSKFISLEDSEATVQLDGKILKTALFNLQFQFSIATAAPEVPLPKTKKGAR